MTTSNVSAHKLSVETCIKHVSQSLIHGRKALLQELSVCVAIFAGAGNIATSTKKLVAEVYQKAGYEAENKKSRHYKTVNRRINAAAGLYSKLGAKKVASWIGDNQEDSLLVAVSKGLEEHKFDSLDDVLEFSGRPNNRSRKAMAQRKPKAEKPKVEMQVIRVPHVKIELPMDMSAENMMKLAAKIINAARQKEQDELKAVIAEGHLTDVKAPTSVAVLH